MSVLSLIHLFPFARIVIKQYIEWMIPDPFKYEMKKNPPKQAAEQEQKPAFQFVPNLSDDELRLLTREKLSAALQAIDPVAQPGMTKALCAEMKDRLDGKPAQAVELTGKNGGAVEVKDITPLETARRVAFLLASAPVVDAEYVEIKS